MKKIINALPLVVFASLIIVLFSFLSDRDDQLETALIDSSFPEFKLGSLSDESRILTKQDIIKLPALINVWATWCPTCYAEHEALKVIEQTGVRIFGVNYADDPDAARRFLFERGDPYVLNILDTEGRLAIDLGVYGAPETFVIDASGDIQYRHVGAVDARVWRDTLGPLIAALDGAESRLP